jgi:hypothetical protein
MILGVGRNGMKRIFQAFLLTGVLLLAASFAFAAERPAVLKKFEEDGNKVEFIGNAYGMDGWMISNAKDQMQTVYTNAEGALVLGILFSPDGVAETQKQLEAYKQRASGSQAAAPAAEQSSSRSEKFYAETEKAAWVALGDSKAPYLYAFINVNCGHCQLFWKDIEGPVKEGKLQVRLVPYGETEANRDGGAALLSAEHPDEAWSAYVSGDKAALSKDKIKAEAYDKIAANTVLAKSGKFGTPPFTLYRRPGDGILTAIAGRPENTMLLLAEFLK